MIYFEWWVWKLKNNTFFVAVFYIYKLSWISKSTTNLIPYLAAIVSHWVKINRDSFIMGVVSLTLGIFSLTFSQHKPGHKCQARLCRVKNRPQNIYLVNGKNNTITITNKVELETLKSEHWQLLIWGRGEVVIAWPVFEWLAGPGSMTVSTYSQATLAQLIIHPSES